MRMRLQMLAWLVFAGLAMQAWGADAGAGASGLEAGCSVKNVRARQRYPWNGKVDIDCEVRGSAGAGCLLTVAAVDKVAGTQLAVKTVSLNGGTGGANPVAVTIGESGTAACRLTWDAEKDLPQGFKCSKVSISVEATEPAKKYLVIDLITGEKTYLAEPPAGGWGAEEFRTRKMAFCRIEPGEFLNQNPLGASRVRITKPYYLAMHTVSVAQHKMIMSNSQSEDVGNSSVPYEDIRGNGWPISGFDVPSGSIVNMLRMKTGLSSIDLPTSAQFLLALQKSGEIDLTSSGGACLDLQPMGYIDNDFSQVMIDPIGPGGIIGSVTMGMTCNPVSINPTFHVRRRNFS